MPTLSRICGKNTLQSRKRNPVYRLKFWSFRCHFLPRKCPHMFIIYVLYIIYKLIRKCVCDKGFVLMKNVRPLWSFCFFFFGAVWFSTHYAMDCWDLFIILVSLVFVNQLKWQRLKWGSDTLSKFFRHIWRALCERRRTVRRILRCDAGGL